MAARKADDYKTTRQQKRGQRRSEASPQPNTAKPLPGKKTKVFRLPDEDALLKRMEGPIDDFEQSVINVDGSFFEGGGQVVRNAMALAAITGQCLRISDVRANRRPGGLAYQHCTGVELVTCICDGTVGGAEVGSTEVRLKPGSLVPGHYVADPETAGATALLAQAALPCLLLAGGIPAAKILESGVSQTGGAGSEEPAGRGANLIAAGGSNSVSKQGGVLEAGAVKDGKREKGGEKTEQLAGLAKLVDYAEDSEQEEGCGSSGGVFSTLLLRGGTDASKAPPIDYTKEVLFPTLKRLLGVEVDLNVKRRGFYPKGNGELTVSIAKTVERGQCLPAFDLTDRGHVVRIRVRAYTAGALPQNVSQEMLQSAKAVLDNFFASPNFSKPPIKYESVRETPESAFGNGAGILLLAETSTGCRLAGSRVLERNQRGADAGREAAEELVGDLRCGGCVDRYLQDQLVVFMAAAEGTSRLLIGQPTMHTCTAVWVAETLTSARFRLLTKDGQPATQLLREPTGGHNEFADPGAECWVLECDGAALKAQPQA